MSKQTETATAARTAAQETFDHAYQHPRLPGYRCAQCGATAADHARAEQTTSAPREAGGHTPGPWHVGMRPGPIIYGPQGEQIASMHVAMLEQDEHLSNARLIASAPDLLSENARLRETLRDILHFGHVGADVKARISIELAKAEGRAQ